MRGQNRVCRWVEKEELSVLFGILNLMHVLLWLKKKKDLCLKLGLLWCLSRDSWPWSISESGKRPVQRINCSSTLWEFWSPCIQILLDTAERAVVVFFVQRQWGERVDTVNQASNEKFESKGEERVSEDEVWKQVWANGLEGTETMQVAHCTTPRGAFTVLCRP